MKIVIFSGGSGSFELQKGLKSYCPNIHITNIINAYDDGKSTGIVRKVMDVLGPSDIRKNQFTYFLNKTGEKPEYIINFYTQRHNIPANEPIEYCIKQLNDFPEDKIKEEFIQCIITFFNTAKDKKIDNFNDFGLPNIIYSVMFNKYGYKKTINIFKEWLEIDDDVILNSTENLILKGQTDNGEILNSEGEIVDHNDPHDPIGRVYFEDYNKQITLFPTTNLNAIEAIQNADLIILSSGTQWASQIPTYMTPGIVRAIYLTDCKKIFIVNNECDKDMAGIRSTKMIRIVSRYLLCLDQFILLFNEDAAFEMKYFYNDYKHKFSAMGNNSGKHDPYKLAQAIYNIYFNDILDKDIDLSFFDFDDTLYSRLESEKKISHKNLELFQELNKKAQISIVSGNSYEHLEACTRPIYKHDFELLDECKIFAALCVEYLDGSIVRYPSEYLFTKEEIQEILYMLKSTEFSYNVNRRPTMIPLCINIKPLTDRQKDIVLQWLKPLSKKYRIFKSGSTSIDIVKYGYDKFIVTEYFNDIKPEKMLYVGDSKDLKNDKLLSDFCYNSIIVNSVIETQVLLKLLLEKYQ